MEITDALQIPDGELIFTFARSGGPGGQNVNKVASKAILHWDLAANTSLPADVRERLRAGSGGASPPRGSWSSRASASAIRPRTSTTAGSGCARWSSKCSVCPRCARKPGRRAGRRSDASPPNASRVSARRGGASQVRKNDRFHLGWSRPGSGHSRFAECSGRSPTRFSPLCHGPVHGLPFHRATGSGVGDPTRFAPNRTGENEMKKGDRNSCGGLLNSCGSLMNSCGGLVGKNSSASRNEATPAAARLVAVQRAWQAARAVLA